MRERLQKILSGCGAASRRHAERLIADGRVRVNGVVADIGASADIGIDLIELDGKAVAPAGELVYIILNKPRGYVTTMSDEKGRKTVKDLTNDCGARVYPVGRLDLNSEGLLILTNDGNVAYRLSHPSSKVEKEYLVWVIGNAAGALAVLSEPMLIEGRKTAAAKVRLVKAAGMVGTGKTAGCRTENGLSKARGKRDGKEPGNGAADENGSGSKTGNKFVGRSDAGNGVSLLSITIHEGRNRQIRRMCEQAGLKVARLKRVSEGKLSLGGLEKGKWRHLAPWEIEYLRNI